MGGQKYGSGVGTRRLCLKAQISGEKFSDQGCSCFGHCSVSCQVSFTVPPLYDNWSWSDRCLVVALIIIPPMW